MPDPVRGFHLGDDLDGDVDPDHVAGVPVLFRTEQRDDSGNPPLLRTATK